MLRVCNVCNKNKVETQKLKSGKICFRSSCQPCRKKGKSYAGCSKKNAKRRVKKISCDICNFKAVHMCQLDVDHIDGNRNNNSIENLQTLCANCHRLKTFLNLDYKNI